MSEPALLVVDTSVALHLILPRPHPGQEEQWKAAHALRRIELKEWTLAMATPALGEVLAGVPTKKRPHAFKNLTKMFKILDLDTFAAREVGDLAGKGVRERSPDVGRQRVKVDVEIVACAIRWGAKGLCALDGDHAGILKRNERSELRVGPPELFTPPQQVLPSFDSEGRVRTRPRTSLSSAANRFE